ncbi:MAG: penicillin-binding protein 1C, partial [Pseudomonadota bacterium]|nr:penicillin-binding protein 1C [Pseudomonadota bacterium]
VSGGSTITMQLARLIEPRRARTLGAKLRQMARAVQIERRLDKDEILQLYLTLATYGGNLEGVRAASLSWFGKAPDHLTVAEAALLVALPQSPESRRPDRHAQAARAARDRVMARMAKAGILEAGEVARVARFDVPRRRLAMPDLAPHLAETARDRDPVARLHRTTLVHGVQAALERLARDAAARLDRRVSVAIVAADAGSGEILASVGSAGFLDEARGGWIDMTQALRSPGSTLKPFVYGLAIEDGMVLPETMISDRPADFSGYRPTNFDRTFQGDVSVRHALQMSLNVPSVRLLDAVTPARLVARMRRAGVNPVLPEGERPGLGIVLGGAGLSLTDLVQLYANVVTQGASPIALGDGIRAVPGRLNGPRPLSGVAAWHVADMLAGIAEPVGSRALGIAYKTGTSYGHRDAWSIGFDGRHVIGVWVGRSDNGAVPGISGIKTAAPIRFEAFAKAGLGIEPMPRAPAGAVRLRTAELPAGLRHFDRAGSATDFSSTPAGERLAIACPADGAELEMALLPDGEALPLVVKLQGGTPPFRLMGDGMPSPDASRRRQLYWTPAGAGTTRLTVLDGRGEARSVEIVLR